MKVLQLCKDMFNDYPNRTSVKEFLQEKRVEYLKENPNAGNETVFNWYSGYFGGRSYNEFLDYGLFALKIHKIYKKRWLEFSSEGYERIKEAIEYLLFDDRHDMYQNVPYCLYDMAKELKDEDEREQFWSEIVTALIQCFNVYETGDQAHNTCLTEGEYG